MPRKRSEASGGAAVAEKPGDAASRADWVANSGELIGADGATKWTPEAARAVFARASELLATAPPSEHSTRLAAASWAGQVELARREAQRPREDVRDSLSGRVVQRGPEPADVLRERLELLDKQRPVFDPIQRRRWVLAALHAVRACGEVVRAETAEGERLSELDRRGRLDEASGKLFDEMNARRSNWYSWTAPTPDAPLGGLAKELAELVPSGINALRDRRLDRLAKMRPALPFAPDALRPLIEADERSLAELGEMVRSASWEDLVSLCARHGVATDAPTVDVPDVTDILSAAAASTERKVR